MSRKILFFIVVGVLAGVHVGTVRRTEDPVRDTQTSGIAYKQKMEEEKDGVKGALTYTVKYNPSDTFFVDPPFDAKEKATAREKSVAEKPPVLSDWWEEQPVQEATASPQQKAPEIEGAVEEQAASTEGATGEAASEATETGNGVGSGDSWW